MIVVDASALLAIVLDEPERPQFRDIVLSEDCLVGAPTVLEAHMALERFNGPRLHAVLDTLLTLPNVQTVPFRPDHLELARQAFDRYGRGSGHAARLNFGDCMSYAIARHRDLPLLYKGNDFPHTDVKSVHRS